MRMRMLLVGTALGVVLVLATAGPRAADDKAAAGILTDAEFTRLAEQTRLRIESALEGAPDDKVLARARTAAVLLAAVAESEHRPATREAALQVAAALRGGKLDDARRLVPILVKPPADPKPAAGPLLGKQASFVEVMALFAPEVRGGNGGEKKLLALTQDKQAKLKNALSNHVMTDDLLLLAVKLSVLGELSHGHKDEVVQKDPKAWQHFAAETRQAGRDLASAVRDRKGNRAWTALNRLNSACEGCHADFRR